MYLHVQVSVRNKLTMVLSLEYKISERVSLVAYEQRQTKVQGDAKHIVGRFNVFK